MEGHSVRKKNAAGQKFAPIYSSFHERFSRQLQADLYRIYADSIYCDWVIAFEGRKIKINRCIIIARAYRFYNCLLSLLSSELTSLQVDCILKFLPKIYYKHDLEEEETAVITELESLTSVVVGSPDSEGFITAACSPSETNNKNEFFDASENLDSTEDFIDNLEKEFPEEELLEKELEEQDHLSHLFESITAKAQVKSSENNSVRCYCQNDIPKTLNFRASRSKVYSRTLNINLLSDMDSGLETTSSDNSGIDLSDPQQKTPKNSDQFCSKERIDSSSSEISLQLQNQFRDGLKTQLSLKELRIMSQQDSSSPETTSFDNLSDSAPHLADPKNTLDPSDSFADLSNPLDSVRDPPNFPVNLSGPLKSNVDPSNFLVNPSNPYGDPSNSHANPSNFVVNPLDSNGDPSNFLVNPFNPVGDPSKPNANPSNFPVNPSDPLDPFEDPSNFLVNPSNPCGDPSNSHANPSNFIVNPLNPNGDPSNPLNSVRDPSNSGANPPNVPVNPSDPSNPFGDPSKSYANPSNSRVISANFLADPSNSSVNLFEGSTNLEQLSSKEQRSMDEHDSSSSDSSEDFEDLGKNIKNSDLVQTKEQKQKQNEEIVIMESSSVSSETGSWESIFPRGSCFNKQSSDSKSSDSKHSDDSKPFPDGKYCSDSKYATNSKHSPDSKVSEWRDSEQSGYKDLKQASEDYKQHLDCIPKRNLAPSNGHYFIDASSLMDETEIRPISTFHPGSEANKTKVTKVKLPEMSESQSDKEKYEEVAEFQKEIRVFDHVNPTNINRPSGHSAGEGLEHSLQIEGEANLEEHPRNGSEKPQKPPWESGESLVGGFRDKKSGSSNGKVGHQFGRTEKSPEQDAAIKIDESPVLVGYHGKNLSDGKVGYQFGRVEKSPEQDAGVKIGLVGFHGKKSGDEKVGYQFERVEKTPAQDPAVKIGEAPGLVEFASKKPGDGKVGYQFERVEISLEQDAAIKIGESPGLVGYHDKKPGDEKVGYQFGRVDKIKIGESLGHVGFPGKQVGDGKVGYQFGDEKSPEGVVPINRSKDQRFSPQRIDAATSPLLESSLESRHLSPDILDNGPLKSEGRPVLGGGFKADIDGRRSFESCPNSEFEYQQLGEFSSVNRQLVEEPSLGGRQPSPDNPDRLSRSESQQVLPWGGFKLGQPFESSPSLVEHRQLVENREFGSVNHQASGENRQGGWKSPPCGFGVDQSGLEVRQTVFESAGQVVLETSSQFGATERDWSFGNHQLAGENLQSHGLGFESHRPTFESLPVFESHQQDLRTHQSEEEDLQAPEASRGEEDLSGRLEKHLESRQSSLEKPSFVRSNTFELEVDDDHITLLRQNNERRQGSLLFQNVIQQYSGHSLNLDDSQPPFPVTPHNSFIQLNEPLMVDHSEISASDQHLATLFFDKSPTSFETSNTLIGETVEGTEECGKSPESSENFEAKPLKREESVPIISGGVSSQDYKPEVRMDSPLSKRKLESTPIVSGGAIIMDEPPQVSKEKPARPASTTAWVVDMKPAEAPKDPPEKPPASRPTHKSSLGFYVDLNELETKRQPDQKIAESADTKKNIFSMFIDFEVPRKNKSNRLSQSLYSKKTEKSSGSMSQSVAVLQPDPSSNLPATNVPSPCQDLQVGSKKPELKPRDFCSKARSFDRNPSPTESLRTGAEFEKSRSFEGDSSSPGCLFLTTAGAVETENRQDLRGFRFKTFDLSSTEHLSLTSAGLEKRQDLRDFRFKTRSFEGNSTPVAHPSLTATAEDREKPQEGASSLRELTSNLREFHQIEEDSSLIGEELEKRQEGPSNLRDFHQFIEGDPSPLVHPSLTAVFIAEERQKIQEGSSNLREFHLKSRSSEEDPSPIGKKLEKRQEGPSNLRDFHQFIEGDPSPVVRPSLTATFTVEERQKRQEGSSNLPEFHLESRTIEEDPSPIGHPSFIDKKQEGSLNPREFSVEKDQSPSGDLRLKATTSAEERKERRKEDLNPREFRSTEENPSPVEPPCLPATVSAEELQKSRNVRGLIPKTCSGRDSSGFRAEERKKQCIKAAVSAEGHEKRQILRGSRHSVQDPSRFTAQEVQTVEDFSLALKPTILADDFEKMQGRSSGLEIFGSKSRSVEKNPSPVADVAQSSSGGPLETSATEFVPEEQGKPGAILREFHSKSRSIAQEPSSATIIHQPKPEVTQKENPEETKEVKSVYMFIESDKVVRRRRSSSNNRSNRHSWNSSGDSDTTSTLCHQRTYSLSGEDSLDPGLKPVIQGNETICPGGFRDGRKVSNKEKEGSRERKEFSREGSREKEIVKEGTLNKSATFTKETAIFSKNNGGFFSNGIYAKEDSKRVDSSSSSDEHKDTSSLTDHSNHSTNHNHNQNHNHGQKMPAITELPQIIETNQSSQTSFVRLSDLDKPALNQPKKVPQDVISPRMTRSIPETSWIESKLLMSRSTGCRSTSRLFPQQIALLSTSTPSNLFLKDGRDGRDMREAREGKEGGQDTDEMVSELSDLSSMHSSTALELSTEDTSSPSGPHHADRLGHDLLRMFLEEISPDVTVEVAGRRLKAHKCILSSRCQYFAAMLSGGWVESAGNVISLQGFTYQAVHFALCHIYSGAAEVPERISLVELATLADMLGLEGLKEVVQQEIKVKQCHSFHKPCNLCVVGILDSLPLAAAYNLDDLYRKSLRWITRYFVRVWATRAFATLPRELQHKCYQQHVVHLAPDTVLETALCCDKLRATLPQVRWADTVRDMVDQLWDVCWGFVGEHFAAVLASASFLSLGKELSWNISRLEESLLRTAERLAPEQSCRSYARVHRLLALLESSDSGENWNANFVELVRKVLARVEDCVVRQAVRVSYTSSWPRLDPSLRTRIQNLCCLPLDRPRISRQPRSTSGSRNLDLRQVRLAMQQHSRRTQSTDSRPSAPRPPPCPVTEPPRPRTWPAQIGKKSQKIISSSESSRTSSPAMKRGGPKKPPSQNAPPSGLPTTRGAKKSHLTGPTVLKNGADKNGGEKQLSRSMPAVNRENRGGKGLHSKSGSGSSAQQSPSALLRAASNANSSSSPSQARSSISPYNGSPSLRRSLLLAARAPQKPPGPTTAPTGKPDVGLAPAAGQKLEASAAAGTQKAAGPKKAGQEKAGQKLVQKVEMRQKVSPRLVGRTASVMSPTKSSAAKCVGTRATKVPQRPPKMAPTAPGHAQKITARKPAEKPQEKSAGVERSGTFLKDEPTVLNKSD